MKPMLEFDTKAMEKLLNYHYPGQCEGTAIYY